MNILTPFHVIPVLINLLFSLCYDIRKLESDGSLLLFLKQKWGCLFIETTISYKITEKQKEHGHC